MMNLQSSLTKTETKLDILHRGTLTEKFSQLLKLLEEKHMEIEGTSR